MIFHTFKLLALSLFESLKLDLNLKRIQYLMRAVSLGIPAGLYGMGESSGTVIVNGRRPRKIKHISERSDSNLKDIPRP